jgi:hypothetical protein
MDGGGMGGHAGRLPAAHWLAADKAGSAPSGFPRRCCSVPPDPGDGMGRVDVVPRSTPTWGR